MLILFSKFDIVDYYFMSSHNVIFRGFVRGLEGELPDHSIQEKCGEWRH